MNSKICQKLSGPLFLLLALCLGPCWQHHTSLQARWWPAGVSTRECEVAFCQLIESLPTTAPIFALPTTDNLFIHRCKQQWPWQTTVPSKIRRGDELKVIAFHSKLLNKGERNYCMTCKELLAVNEALKAYHYCICGKQLLIHNQSTCPEMVAEVQKPGWPAC